MLETEPQIIASYVATGKAKLIYRHLVQLGDGSLRTAEASECAADQGQFWPMHDLLYARQDVIYATADMDATLIGFAQDLSLDTAAFGTCMQAQTHRAAVLADNQAAQAAGIRGRPVFDINGTRIVGARPFSAFQRVIDAAQPR